MKKIGILTLNGNFNYGNRLQNYALQRFLESYGCEVETIVIDSTLNIPVKSLTLTKRIKKLFDNGIYGVPDKLKQKLFNKNKHWIQNLKRQREINFENFTDNYIKYVNIKNADIGQLDEKYSVFVVGSDQVWNPFYPEFSDIYLLSFVINSIKVSYAASFGIEVLNENQKNVFKKYLPKFDKISVRELNGKEILSDILDRGDIEVLPDPTMLIKASQWRNFIKEININIEKNYLLTYFLGPVSVKRKKEIASIARLRNLDIINLANTKDYKYYISDPKVFISLIDNSDIFCTDSFHGVAFSIILKKAFIVYRRNSEHSMFSRMETILKKFKLQSRKVENLRLNHEIFENSYFDDVDTILDKEIKQAKNYFKDILN